MGISKAVYLLDTIWNLPEELQQYLQGRVKVDV